MVRNYQNADCSLKINLLFIYYNFRHTSHSIVPYLVYILIDQLTQRIDLTSSVTCRRHGLLIAAVSIHSGISGSCSIFRMLNFRFSNE